MFLAYLALASIVYVVGSFHAQRTSPLINTAHVMGSRHYALRMTSPFVSASSSPLEVDVAVLGGGIAGSTISYLLAEQQGLQTALIDPAGDSIGTWYPNYGEWRKEWHCLSERLNLPELKECTTNEWEYTDVFFGGSHGVPMDSRKTLDVPYVRVDRIKLQSLLRNRFKSSGKGMIIKSKVNTKTTSKNLFHNHNIIHHNEGSTITLENGDVVNAKLILDSTGLESQLIQREKPRFARGVDKELNTGYQIAYGVSYHVTSTGPFRLIPFLCYDYFVPNDDDDDDDDECTNTLLLSPLCAIMSLLLCGLLLLNDSLIVNLKSLCRPLQ
jgi:flavin-dependent dehydrogenase